MLFFFKSSLNAYLLDEWHDITDAKKITRIKMNYRRYIHIGTSKRKL